MSDSRTDGERAEPARKNGGSEGVRDIPKWAGRYAQHRTLEMILGMCVFLLLSAGIALPSYWGGMAYRDGKMVLFAVCLAAVVPAVAGVIWLATPKGGAKRLHELAMRLYGNEGAAGKDSFPGNVKITLLDRAVAGLFMACTIGMIVLGVRGYLPREYMQPISAIYCVPFLIYQILRHRRGFCAWLWPLLYALHAVLMVAGAPIRFTGEWEILNILIPVGGYGLLTAFIGHLYSRYALKKLKGLSRMDSPDQTGRSEV